MILLMIDTQDTLKRVLKLKIIGLILYYGEDGLSKNVGEKAKAIVSYICQAWCWYA